MLGEASDDAERPRILREPPVVLVRDAEQRLVGHEHHDEVGCGSELTPVRLRGELHGVVAYLTRVRRQARRPLGLVGRLEGLEVRGERDLCVDDQLLAARDPDDEVRPQEIALSVAGRRLRDEVAVLEHSGELDDVPKLSLAPPTADGRRAERVREIARPLAEQGHLLAERAERLLARTIELLDAEPDVAERLLQRRDRRLELPLGLVEIPRTALPEGLRGRGAHRLGQTGVERALRRVEARRRAGELTFELEHALSTRATLRERRAQEKEGAEGTDDEADEECHDRHEGEGP